MNESLHSLNNKMIGNVLFFFPHLFFPGGNGYINDYPTGRFLRDAKLLEIGGGTSEIRRLIIGRTMNEMFKQ